MSTRRTNIAHESITEGWRQARVELPEPVGTVELVWSETGLVALRWEAEGPAEGVPSTMHAPAAWRSALRAYAVGDDVDPAREIPVDLRGTEFQIATWRALRAVRRGRVRTYTGIAADVGRPRAMRAIGAANGANAIPIVVPCHRIVGAGLKLGGYSGGPNRKRDLLALEGVKLEGDRLLPGQLDLYF